MATCRLDILDSTNLLYGLRNVHLAPGVPHHTTNLLSPLEGTFCYRQNVERDVSHRESMYILIVIRHDDVINDVSASHTRDPASRTGHIHAYLQPLGKSIITKTTIQTINCSGPHWETPSKLHECYCLSRLALFRWLCAVTLLHYFSCTPDISSGPLAHKQRLGANKAHGASDLKELPPSYRSFSSRYSRDSVTCRTDATE